MSLSGPRLFKSLVAAALEYHAREPWEEIADTETFALRLEGEADPVLASVMGQAGLEYGLALFRGENALGKLRAAYAAGNDGEELFEAMSSLAVTLQPLREVPPEFRSVLVQAGFERRREDIAPFFMSKSPGRRAREINKAEARLLLLAMHGILAALDEGALPESGPKGASCDGLMTVITVTGDPQSPEVAFGRERFSDGVPTAAPSLVAAQDRLASLPRLDSRWLVGFTSSSMSVAGDDRALRLLLIVEDGSSKIIGAEALHSTDFGEAVSAVLDAMKGANLPGERGRPREIVVSNRALFDVLSPSLAVASVPCRFAERIELLEEAATDFREWMYRGGVRHGRARMQGDPPADDDLDGWKAADLRATNWLLDRVSAAGIVTPREVRRFFGSADALDPSADEEGGWSQSMRASLFEWAAVGVRRTRKGGNFVDQLLRDDPLDPSVRTILEARQRARPGLFRVARVNPGVSLDIVDIVTGDAISLHDRALSQGVEVGLVIPLRAMKIGRFLFPVIVAPSIPNHLLPEALAFLRSVGLEMTREGIERDWRLLGRLWEWSLEVKRRVLASGPPRLENTDGEDLVWHVASYSVANEAATRRAFDARPDIERDGERFSWLKRGKGFGGGDLGLGQIEFVAGEIVVQVNSAERHERSRKWLEAIPGVKLLGVTRRRIDRPGDLPRDDRRSADEEAEERKAIESLPPEAKESIGKLIRQHYLKWIDEPLPMLGGQSPRERCRTAEGRREVAALIRGIPGTPGPGGGTIEPPREEMLRRLGLEGGG